MKKQTDFSPKAVEMNTAFWLTLGRVKAPLKLFNYVLLNRKQTTN